MATLGKIPTNITGNNANKHIDFHKTQNNDLVNLCQNYSKESVSLYGTDIKYIKLEKINPTNINRMFGELKKYEYKDVFDIRLYVENGTEYGNNITFGQAGKLLKDEVNFFINIQQMDSILGRKPINGDLIYYDPAQRMFRVEHVFSETFQHVGRNLVQYKLFCREWIITENTVIETDNVEINTFNELSELTKLKTTDEHIENLVDKEEVDPFNVR